MQSFFQEDYINTWLYWHGFYMVKLPHRYCNHLDINTISRHMEYHTEGLEYHQGEEREENAQAAPGQSSLTQSRVRNPAHLEL